MNKKVLVIRPLLTSASFLVLLTGSAVSVSADAIFDFNNDTLGTATTFTDIDAATGLAAAFHSYSFGGGAEIPGLFDVETRPAGIGSGNRLTEISGSRDASLQIVFGANVTSAAFPFAIYAPAGDTLTLTAFLNGTQVGSIQAVANTPFDAYSIGNISFNQNVAFDSLLLSAANSSGTPQPFAVDDIDVKPLPNETGVPEPAPAALFFAGIGGVLGLTVLRLRRKRCDRPSFQTDQSSGHPIWRG